MEAAQRIVLGRIGKNAGVREVTECFTHNEDHVRLRFGYRVDLLVGLRPALNLLGEVVDGFLHGIAAIVCQKTVGKPAAFVGQRDIRTIDLGQQTCVERVACVNAGDAQNKGQRRSRCPDQTEGELQPRTAEEQPARRDHEHGKQEDSQNGKMQVKRVFLCGRQRLAQKREVGGNKRVVAAAGFD